MKKKLLATLLTASMVASLLVGCGGAGDVELPAEAPAAEAEAEADEAEEPAAEEAEAPAEEAAAGELFVEGLKGPISTEGATN